jgi:hypothetical protein
LAGVPGRYAGVAGHDVRVDVDRVDRIGHGDPVAAAEDLERRARVGLRTIAQEDLVVGHVDATRAEVAVRDRRAHEVVSGRGPVALEALARRQVIDRGMQGLDDGVGKRLGHVADAAADDARGERGVRGGEALDASRDLGEQVAGRQLQEMLVDACHGALGSGGQDDGRGLGGGDVGHDHVAGA